MSNFNFRRPVIPVKPKESKCKVRIKRKDGETRYESSGCTKEEIQAFKESNSE